MSRNDNRTALDAAVFRRLLEHLSLRADVQNIDLMGVAGFCRNCLAAWYEEAARDAGIALERDEARTRIYGMDYEEYKTRHQTPATDEQIARMAESMEKNKTAHRR